MATRNFVPRSGSEGQIGTSTKPWGVVVADVGHFAALSGSISGSSESTGSFGHLIVAGNITASGDIRSDGRIFEKNTSVIDHATAMAIVFGG